MNLLLWIAVAALLPLRTVGIFASHTLDSGQKSVIVAWLSNHPGYRLANDRDCSCDEDIKEMRAGDGGVWKPVPDYHPYITSGDFNDDGSMDFAVVVINTRKAHDFTLLVFNGPLDVGHPVPAFVDRGDFAGIGLAYGPPRPKPYRLIIGRFASEGLLLQPRGKTYRLVE
jgi:hypothetical protein